MCTQFGFHEVESKLKNLVLVILQDHLENLNQSIMSNTGPRYIHIYHIISRGITAVFIDCCQHNCIQTVNMDIDKLRTKLELLYLILPKCIAVCHAQRCSCLLVMKFPSPGVKYVLLSNTPLQLHFKSDHVEVQVLLIV